MHWLSYQWFAYWWPSDKGNGPENVQWTLIAVIVASLLIPKVRNFINNHVKSIHEKLEKHHEALLRQNEEHHETAIRLARQHHREHLEALKVKPQRDERGRFK